MISVSVIGVFPFEVKENLGMIRRVHIDIVNPYREIER
jgi:hypothetical protein